MHLSDTILALASAPGGGVRGILRLSGSAVGEIVGRTFRTNDGCAKFDPSAIRRPSVIEGRLDLGNHLLLPTTLHYWPTSRSYTREPVAELHTVGSPPLLQRGLRVLCEAGARPARPGEFTLRAFLAGRIDLTQAEAVLGVIDAHDERELRTALAQLAGGIAGPLQRLREQLLDLLSHLEAGLDFVDEDIEFISAADLQQQLAAATTHVESLVGRLDTRTDAEQTPRVVLLGEPNAGKSSLLNALAESNAALVSPQAGTTRDFVSRRLLIAGQWLEVVDTAGISDADRGENSIAAAAQQQTAAAGERATIRLVCCDGSRPFSSWETAQLESLREVSPTAENGPTIVVVTKADIARNVSLPQLACPVVVTSSTTGHGLEDLRTAIATLLAQKSSDIVPQTAVRCRDSLRLAAEALARASEAAADSLGEELVASELRLALDELGQVVGAVYTDDILDRIFSRFCIGK